jgi:hypothetical protein
MPSQVMNSSLTGAAERFVKQNPAHRLIFFDFVVLL